MYTKHVQSVVLNFQSSIKVLFFIFLVPGEKCDLQMKIQEKNQYNILCSESIKYVIQILKSI